MESYFRIHPGVLILERADGIYIGHIDSYEIIHDLSMLPLLRAMREWTCTRDLVDITDYEERAIKTLIALLKRKDLIDIRPAAYRSDEIVISHFNEIGSHLSSILFERGFAVATLDKRFASMNDVRGQMIKVENVGESFEKILLKQEREITNSGFISQRRSRNGMKNARSLIVFTAYPEPETLAQLMADGTPHLYIATTPLGVHAGPIVIPGATPCFHCIELHRSNRDPYWQKVAALLFSERLDRAPMHHALLAAASAAQLITSFNEREIAHDRIALTTTLKFESANSVGGCAIRAENLSWDFHPECSCHWGGVLSTRGR